MVVKSVRGRRRYIVFTLDPGFTRETLISKLHALNGDDAPYVVQCGEGWAVIRSSPERIDVDIDIVKKADHNSESVSTSGTLKTLRDRYEVLRRTKVPARK